MVEDFHFWLYLVNSVLLILHEMDSAYWQEWRLFRLPGGIAGFLAIHIPLLGLVLWGLVQVWQGTAAGLVFSLALAGSGILAFAIHTIFIKRGHGEFTTTASLMLLRLILVVSVIQLLITGYLALA